MWNWRRQKNSRLKSLCAGQNAPPTPSIAASKPPWAVSAVALACSSARTRQCAEKGRYRLRPRRQRFRFAVRHAPHHVMLRDAVTGVICSPVTAFASCKMWIKITKQRRREEFDGGWHTNSWPPAGWWNTNCKQNTGGKWCIWRT